MRNLTVIALLLVSILTACGEATENREMMHIRAKQVQDSIANYIKARMAEAEAPAQMVMPAPPATQAATDQVSPNPHK